MLLRIGGFMVGDTKREQQKKQVSMKLMACLAPAEIEAEDVAKADQNQLPWLSGSAWKFNHPVWCGGGGG
jgi:hypothetical protein